MLMWPRYKVWYITFNVICSKIHYLYDDLDMQYGILLYGNPDMQYGILSYSYLDMQYGILRYGNLDMLYGMVCYLYGDPDIQLCTLPLW